MRSRDVQLSRAPDRCGSFELVIGAVREVRARTIACAYRAVPRGADSSLKHRRNRAENVAYDNLDSG